MPPAPPQRAKHILVCGGRSGFTLIELLVVLVLLSIMLAVTVPRFRATVLDDPLNSSARLLIGLIREARQQAPQSDRGCYLTIDIEGGRIDLVCPLPIKAEQPDSEEESDDREDAPLASKTLVEPVKIESIFQGESERITSGVVRLWVNRRGLMEPAIINLAAEDETISVTVSPFLPGVELADHETSPEDAGWRQ